MRLSPVLCFARPGKPTSVRPLRCAGPAKELFFSMCPSGMLSGRASLAFGDGRREPQGPAVSQIPLRKVDLVSTLGIEVSSE